jgi:hypothetical protein
MNFSLPHNPLIAVNMIEFYMDAKNTCKSLIFVPESS